MTALVTTLAQEFSQPQPNLESVIHLLDEGATIPFLARYRKERTGGMDEVQLRKIANRIGELRELEKRKDTILKEIASQEQLTPELAAKIRACTDKTTLEDLYLPYKPKRRTRATKAKEKGLASLADRIQYLNASQTKKVDLETEAMPYLSDEVKTVEEALQGAGDILAEQFAENADLRAKLRDYLFKNGTFVSKVKSDYPEGTTKYEMYRDFQAAVKQIPPHNLLALLRGEKEGVLTVSLVSDEQMVLSQLMQEEVTTQSSRLREFYQQLLQDAWRRLLQPALEREIRRDCKHDADLESIKTFETNLRQLLLAPPAGMKPTLAIDPGFRTGCKVAILSETGQFLNHETIYPHSGQKKREQASRTIQELLKHYQIELIGFGNGTASRETEEFLSETLAKIEQKPLMVRVNESGASIYSASEVARKEFPDLDATVRGAISIGRRLQDPLAELVKIDPKSIGVGQYQHDVDQKLLKNKLEETVESCVNYVGVDLNTASQQLLVFISGINSAIAQNIIKYRDEKGTFSSRQELLNIPKLGAKTFEQCAGFLRIRNGDNPLDNTAVHPERYPLLEQLFQQWNIPLTQPTKLAEKLKSVDLQQYVSDDVGLPTLEDIIAELEKPGRDPRETFQSASFREDVKEISDLQLGMILEGVVTNVVNFGAFVDIGVHQDGLIHISQLADQFVQHPSDIVNVGDVVKVKVLEVQEKLKRISLSRREIT